MPLKKYAKKSYRKVKKSYKSRKSSNVMVNRMPAMSHTVVAPKYYTNLEYSFNATIGTTYGSGYFDIAPCNPIGNALYAGDGKSTINPIPATVALTALKPTGLTLLKTLYNSLRVHSSRLRVSLTPTLGADTSMLCIVPYNSTSDTVAPTDIQTAQSQPYSKNITCSAFNNLKMNGINHGMSHKKLLGLDYKQFVCEKDTANVWGEDPSQEIIYRVLWQQYSNAAPNGQMNLEIKLSLRCEFFDPLQSLGDQ